MGSFDPKDPFVCANETCNRKAWCHDDDGAFLCYICNQRLINEHQGRSLRRRLSTDRPRTDDTLTLQDVLAVEAVGVQTMSSLMGSGWALQCPCGFCARQWLDDGWVCPADYYRREYLHILDEIHDGEGRAEVDWDIMVVRLHLMLYRPDSYGYDFFLTKFMVGMKRRGRVPCLQLRQAIFQR